MTQPHADRTSEFLGKPGPCPDPGLIVREKEPENLESPFSALDGPITSNERFYVRSHFAQPGLRLNSWRVRIEGAVEHPFEMTYADLMGMPAETFPVTLECAGNGRVFLVPQVQGAQWGLGAVSTAQWTGVRLSAVLERAGVKPTAIEVVLEGADDGKPKEPPAPPDKIRYARSIPLSKANDGVLLAYKMNGEPLAPAHGHPLRAVVPGWYGMASVKWLTRIVVSDRPFQGYFQTTDYAYWEPRDGIPVRVPITEVQVKAQIARPALNEVVPRDSEYLVFGAAWGGESEVARVELSTDGGETYRKASLLGQQVPCQWRLWELRWRTPAEGGTCTLMARATDERGRVQPRERDRNWGSYVVHHTLPVDVLVR